MKELLRFCYSSIITQSHVINWGACSCRLALFMWLSLWKILEQLKLDLYFTTPIFHWLHPTQKSTRNAGNLVLFYWSFIDVCAV